MLKDFKEKTIENHYLVRAAMVTHLVNTYIPKSEMDLSKSRTSSLEIKCSELETLVQAQKELIDNNVTGLGNLRKDFNAKK